MRMTELPKLWIVPGDGEMQVYETEQEDGTPVEMNASLYRQIKAANKKYYKFQILLMDFYNEAVEAQAMRDFIRRVR